MRDRLRRYMAVLTAAALFLAAAGGNAAGAKNTTEGQKQETLLGESAKKTISVGEQLSVKRKWKNAVYRSSDSRTACVSSKGIVTGKKQGKTVISVKARNHKTEQVTVTVTNKKRKPAIPAALDEIHLDRLKMKKGKSGKYRFSAVVKNTAKNGSVKKIIYSYQITAIKKTAAATASGSAVSASKKITKKVTLKAKRIRAGKKSARVSCEGDYRGKFSGMKLKKIVLYTGEARLSYTVSGKKLSLAWAKPDKKAPKITGWVGKNSFNGRIPYRVCYSDRKKTYHFREHISAVDDRDGKVSVKVDDSRINWKKEGVYKVYYTAADRAGNTASEWAKVQVYLPGTAEEIADTVLKRIAGKNLSDEEAARAIYRYVTGQCSYIDTGSHVNWRDAAVHGIRYRSGDCFTFYSMTRLLLSRAGIPNIEVTRYPSYEGYHHWWNLVYVRGGWYHLDTTPRHQKGVFCLVTDEQLHGWPGGSSSTFRFQESIYPKRAKKKISPNP